GGVGVAGPGVARFVVGGARQVPGLGRLDDVDHVEDDHALLHGPPVVLEGATLGVAPPDPHRDVGGRHHLRSWRSCLSSSGISGSGSWVTLNLPSRRRMTMLTLPNPSSA